MLINKNKGKGLEISQQTNMNNYVYPRFSKHDIYCLFRLGGAGLGNLLLVYSRALIYSEKYNIPMIWPTWYSLKLGPYIRHEMDKRKYNDLFVNNSGCVDGLAKIKLMLTMDKISENDIDDVDNLENKIIICERTRCKKGIWFEPIMEYSDLIRQNLIKNLRDENRSVLSYDFSDSITVHIRLGDYARVQNTKLLEDGNEAVAIPVEWYYEVIKQIRQIVGRDIKVYIFSDGTDDELSEILSLNNVERITFGNAISDIFGLSKANLLIASGGSFSMWGRFLGRMDVITYKGQLKQRLKLDNEDFMELEVKDSSELAQVKDYLQRKFSKV